jgi:hypothetical protein
MLSLNKLITELNAKPSGENKFMALCPAHEDKNPSLSITDTGNKILVYCHAGCNQKNVINKLIELGCHDDSKDKNTFVKKEFFLEKRILDYTKNLTSELINFLENERFINLKTIQDYKLGQKGNAIAIPIADETGNINDIRLYTPLINRLAKQPKVVPDTDTDAKPKLFPIQNINKIKLEYPNGSLESLGNLENLDPKTFILLCEGEMDALAGSAAGFYTLTNTCGAKTWSDQFSETIANLYMPVIILMDNDNPGEEGALYCSVAQ